ncbi:MAG: RNA pseudouridine synthase [Saprospiraceae bacterium]|nr:RNA pseudouridine synthase [Saprospiraceae bacterium]
MSDLDIGSLICEKNNQFIAFNKPSGIAVQSNNAEDFHHWANAYAKRNLFLVHRIDQPVSGLILMARNKKAASLLGTQFREGSVERTYHAIVDSRPESDNGELRHFLVYDKKSNKVKIVDQTGDGVKQSILSYRYLASSDTYHLLEVRIQSGRKHQIRAQLAAVGMHIKGDVKYGARRGNRDRSIHLHASSLTIVHPVSNEKITLTAPWPDEVLWNFFRSTIE